MTDKARELFDVWARDRGMPVNLREAGGYLDSYTNSFWEAWNAALRTAPAIDLVEDLSHPDDLAVNLFAEAMKEKLSLARAKGRGGWDSDELGLNQTLSTLLREHVEKGDPCDVANFCMFLHQRGEGISSKRSRDVFREYLSANVESNKRAAINSPQGADWSNGVSAGFSAALKEYEETHSAIGARTAPEGWVQLADIDPRDLQVDCYPSASESSFSSRVPKGVKITHKSGAAVICDTERSQHANRDKAMRGISAMLAAAKE